MCVKCTISYSRRLKYIVLIYLSHTELACIKIIDLWQCVRCLVPNAARNMEATVGETSLTLTWDAPVSGRVETYTAMLKTGSGLKHTSNVTTSTATFTGLTAGKQYTVVVVTVCGDQISKPLENNFHTSTCIIVLLQLIKLYVDRYETPVMVFECRYHESHLE